jgi:hypothetical protein
MVLRVHTTSEGIGDSYADPAVLLGGIATGVRAIASVALRRGGEAVVGRLGATASEGSGTALAISSATKFTSVETTGLRLLMGSSESGARNFLERVLAGQVHVPEGVTRYTLERYITKVIDKGPNTAGAASQQMRIQGILKLLEHMP